jgi:hypothetical protein
MVGESEGERERVERKRVAEYSHPCCLYSSANVYITEFPRKGKWI